jgi:hypothetical protein
MLDFSAHLRFGPVSRPLDLIDNTAMAIAPVDKVPGLGGVLPDHRPLAAVGLITPHAGLFAMQQIGHTALSATLAGVATTAWISLLRRSTEMPLHAGRAFLWKIKAPEIEWESFCFAVSHTFSK